MPGLTRVARCGHTVYTNLGGFCSASPGHSEEAGEVIHRQTRGYRAAHRFCGSCSFADLHIIHVVFRQSVRTNALSVCNPLPSLASPHSRGPDHPPVRFAAFSLVSANVHCHSCPSADVTNSSLRSKTCRVSSTYSALMYVKYTGPVVLHDVYFVVRHTTPLP